MFEKYLTKTGRLSSKQPQDIKNQWYIQKFQEVHGNRFDYSNVIYVGSAKKVEIVCNKHGSFFQTPNTHLKGVGCPTCQSNKTKDTEQCIKDFEQVHGDTYDYSLVDYKTTREKVSIICKQHGSFFQSPNSHLKGEGCPKCQSKQKKDTEQCIEDFKKVHGGTYDYSLVDYKTAKEKVSIICKQHGSFLQRPNDHLSGQGCPKCSNHNQDTLYILKCLDTGLIKIGITNNLDKRISSIGGNLEYLHHIRLTDPRQLERQLHQRYKYQQVFNPNVRSGGTEFFQLSDQQVSQLIESLKIA